MHLSASGELPRTAADIPVEVYTRPEQTHSTNKPSDGVGSEESAASEIGPAPPHKICVVCQRAVDYHAAVKKLVCTHLCHADCADRWLRSELHCPLCKNQVLFPIAHPAILHPDRLPNQPRAYGTPRPVPFNGMDVRQYGICRDCQQAFYRDPRTIKPETNAWYRCPRCRGFDVANMIRASCTLQ